MVATVTMPARMWAARVPSHNLQKLINHDCHGQNIASGALQSHSGIVNVNSARHMKSAAAIVNE